MKNQKEYGGIDIFRIIAAILIVAIHTSPLSSINSTADFLFTRIIARVGVPFFFMTSGFFKKDGHSLYDIDSSLSSGEFLCRLFQ